MIRKLALTVAKKEVQRNLLAVSTQSTFLLSLLVLWISEAVASGKRRSRAFVYMGCREGQEIEGEREAYRVVMIR